MDAVTSQPPDSTLHSTLSRSPAKETEPVCLSKVCPIFIERVPIAFARRFGVLGLAHENGVMPVAVGSTQSSSVLDKITTLLGVATQGVKVDPEALQSAISTAYGVQASGVENLIEDMGDAERREVLDEMARAGDLLDSSTASPVTKLVNLILLDAVRRRASDVHVQPFDDHLQVRLRIDGVLYDYVRPPQALGGEIVSRIKVMGRMDIAEKRLPQDGRTTVRVGEKVVDLRISSLPTGCGERVVLRLLDKSARLYHLSELGMADSDQKVFRNLICRTHGIMLVTGPTGSGKSTTLYAALMELNSEELNILTLEDPIEYQLPGISQTQVSNQKGMTFATGLRTVLRQDPDVIMVGEIRDEETARMAIQSSLTGHLVFSTLHTNDAAGAVARLLDLSVEPYLVAGSLLGVMAQRLVRRVCGKCRRTVGLSAEAVRLLRLAEDLRDHEVYEPAGCTACHQTGYCDRVGVFELLRVNEALRSLIVDRPTSDAVRTTARHAGMTTLREDAMRKLLAGITTVEDVLRVTHQEVDDSEPTPAD